jgi:hypothetical protein
MISLALNNATESVDTETHDVSGPPAMMQERAGGARGLDDTPETVAWIERSHAAFEPSRSSQAQT